MQYFLNDSDNFSVQEKFWILIFFLLLTGSWSFADCEKITYKSVFFIILLKNALKSWKREKQKKVDLKFKNVVQYGLYNIFSYAWTTLIIKFYWYCFSFESEVFAQLIKHEHEQSFESKNKLTIFFCNI